MCQDVHELSVDVNVSPAICSSRQGACLYRILCITVYDFVLQVLRQIQYTNRKPAYYLNRVFKLTCSELNGRFLSNEYVQTVRI
jgi:hypothetical protein